MEERNITISQIKYTLKKVDYEHFASPNENTELKITDSVYPVTIKADGFDLIFERSVTFDPKKLFDIKVQYLVECGFDENTTKYLNADYDKIEKFVENNRVNLVNRLPVVAQSAMIISNLSIFVNQKPLVLPPVIK